jgi:hypothetical protein
MITKDNYITAYFIDNERKNIEVLLKNVESFAQKLVREKDAGIISISDKDKDKTAINSYILEYDIDNPICQELLELCPLDDLHKNTHIKKTGEKKDFEDMVMRIAKKEGLVVDELELDTKFYPAIVKAIFEEKETLDELGALKSLKKNDKEDHLFALKLALFEVEKIRDSKDSELKKKLRQAKTKIEAFKIAIEIAYA